MGSLLSKSSLIGMALALVAVAAANRVDFTRRLLNG